MASDPREWRAERQKLAELQPYGLGYVGFDFDWGESKAKVLLNGDSHAARRLFAGEITESEYSAEAPSGWLSSPANRALSDWQLERAKAMKQQGLPGFVGFVVHMGKTYEEPPMEDILPTYPFEALEAEAFRQANAACKERAGTMDQREKSMLVEQLERDFPTQIEAEMWRPGSQWWLDDKGQFEYAMGLATNGHPQRRKIISILERAPQFSYRYAQAREHYDNMCKTQFWKIR